MEEVQVDGAPAEHAEHLKTPEIIESTLKYLAPTFRKAFSSNKKSDILQRLKEIIHSERPFMDGKTRFNTENL